MLKKQKSDGLTYLSQQGLLNMRSFGISRRHGQGVGDNAPEETSASQLHGGTSVSEFGCHDRGDLQKFSFSP